MIFEVVFVLSVISFAALLVFFFLLNKHHLQLIKINQEFERYLDDEIDMDKYKEFIKNRPFMLKREKRYLLEPFK